MLSYMSISLLHLIGTLSLDCSKRPHQALDLYLLGFKNISYDVHTMMKSSDDAFLRTHPVLMMHAYTARRK